MTLNIEAPAEIFNNCNYKFLYTKLYDNVLNHYIEEDLKLLLSFYSTPDDYLNLYEKLKKLFCIKDNDPSLRFVLCEPDGTVIMDSYKGSLNTFCNWKDKLINENHNGRLAFKNAQCYNEGIGFEKKKSTTVDPLKYYNVAIRLGIKTKNYGTLRFSKNA